jgi:hypothetical protein
MVALAIGVACGAIRGQPLEGPQGVGNPCGACQEGLTCGDAQGSTVLPVCVRRCDAGCLKGETCVAGACERPCAVVNDCGIRVVEQTCRVVGDAGVCAVLPCYGSADCHGSYLCTKEPTAAGCQPIFTPPGYCRRTP